MALLHVIFSVLWFGIPLHPHRSLSGHWSHRCTSTHHIIVSGSETISLIHIVNIHHCQSSHCTQKECGSAAVCVIHTIVSHHHKTKKRMWFGKNVLSPHHHHSSQRSVHMHLSPPIITTPYASVRKMWCRMFRTKFFRFSPEGSCFVNKSASLSCVLTYVVRHSSLAEPSRTKW